MNCFFQVTKHKQAVSHVVDGRHVAWIDGECLLVACYGLSDLTFLEIDVAEVEVRFKLMRRQLAAQTKMVNRLVKGLFSLQEEAVAQAVVCLWLFLVQL